MQGGFLSGVIDRCSVSRREAVLDAAMYEYVLECKRQRSHLPEHTTQDSNRWLVASRCGPALSVAAESALTLTLPGHRGMRRPRGEGGHGAV